jgi:hypothetical protein
MRGLPAVLTCYRGRVCLPQNDLAYVGFRLAALDTLCQMDICQGRWEEEDTPFGYLMEAPILAEADPAVQVDLLADAWRRHRDAAPYEASLLDAAVVYAAFETAGRVIGDQPELIRPWLKAGPRKVRRRIGPRAPGRLRAMFFEFWDDVDFLSLEDLQDLAPEHARAVRALMRLPEREMEEIEGVLARGRASPSVLTGLLGLLSEEEIRGFSGVLLPGGPS